MLLHVLIMRQAFSYRLRSLLPWAWQVLESPQVQAWLDEQRRKITDLLRSIGEELDPASRRAAEAFAFEGRTPAADVGVRREAAGSQNATAVATGRSLSNTGLDNMSRSRVYNIPVRGPADPAEAEERRRKGREYLAKRNQQMIELRQRRKSTQETNNPTSPTATSFDEMIDAQGRLRSLGEDRELPSPPGAEPVSSKPRSMVETLDESSLQPLLVDAGSSSSSAWQLGSQLANPFGDEYALDRSDTPKPPRPPKIELDTTNGQSCIASPAVQQLPGSFSPQPLGERLSGPIEDPSDLSYEEQLAIALSLSEAENQSQHSSHTEDDERSEDAALQAAIKASLEEMEERQAHHRAGWSFEQEPQQLIDIEPAGPSQDVAANTVSLFQCHRRYIATLDPHTKVINSKTHMGLQHNPHSYPNSLSAFLAIKGQHRIAGLMSSITSHHSRLPHASSTLKLFSLLHQSFHRMQAHISAR